MIGVLLDDSSGVLIGVERIHQDEGNVDFVKRVEMLSTTKSGTSSNRVESKERETTAKLTSIWRTLKSKKVMPSRTSMTDLGPTHPIVVPNPPFNFSTASLSSKEGVLHSGKSA